MPKPRCLGICLFYNDEDIVAEALTHLLENNHEVVVWDHGSDDRTAQVLDQFGHHIRERHFLPRSFDFYKLFEHVSRYVIEHYAPHYDWISFPESDEFLEGPDRKKSYFEYVCDVVESPFDWVQFNNIVFWFTNADDMAEISTRKRVRHYSIWSDCAPRIYAWRARCMNVRWFNHNPANGLQYPINFNTCHYQMRSEVQMMKRINSRIGLSRENLNFHFDFMELNRDRLFIRPDQLHIDDGLFDLSTIQTLDWKEVYGTFDQLTEQIKAKKAQSDLEDGNHGFSSDPLHDGT